MSVQLYTHPADSTRSSTSKTELFHLPIDDANLMRRRLGVDLPWVCVGPAKIVCGRVRTGPNRRVHRRSVEFNTIRIARVVDETGRDRPLYVTISRFVEFPDIGFDAASCVSG